MTNEDSRGGEPEGEDDPSPGAADPKASATDRGTLPPASGGTTNATRPAEIGGQKGPEPTRYGDWEKKGRCTDF